MSKVYQAITPGLLGLAGGDSPGQFLAWLIFRLRRYSYKDREGWPWLVTTRAQIEEFTGFSSKVIRNALQILRDRELIRTHVTGFAELRQTHLTVTEQVIPYLTETPVRTHKGLLKIIAPCIMAPIMAPEGHYDSAKRAIMPITLMKELKRKKKKPSALQRGEFGQEEQEENRSQTGEENMGVKKVQGSALNLSAEMNQEHASTHLDELIPLAAKPHEFERVWRLAHARYRQKGRITPWTQKTYGQVNHILRDLIHLESPGLFFVAVVRGWSNLLTHLRDHHDMFWSGPTSPDIGFVLHQLAGILEWYQYIESGEAEILDEEDDGIPTVLKGKGY